MIQLDWNKSHGNLPAMSWLDGCQIRSYLLWFDLQWPLLESRSLTCYDLIGQLQSKDSYFLWFDWTESWVKGTYLLRVDLTSTRVKVTYLLSVDLTFTKVKVIYISDSAVFWLCNLPSSVRGAACKHVRLQSSSSSKLLALPSHPPYQNLSQTCDDEL